MAKKIYVGSIADTTTKENLIGHFSQIGTVLTAEINNKISFQKNSRYAYVMMNSTEETKQAILKLNNSLLDGSKIRVLEAHSLDQEKQYKPMYKRKY